VGGITACGIFLFIISVVGIVGAIKHHQVSHSLKSLYRFTVWIRKDP
jgi:hypothetical protein